MRSWAIPDASRKGACHTRGMKTYRIARGDPTLDHWVVVADEPSNAAPIAFFETKEEAQAESDRLNAVGPRESV